jgi:hypothetical protein
MLVFHLTYGILDAAATDLGAGATALRIGFYLPDVRKQYLLLFDKVYFDVAPEASKYVAQ